jgi:hypothetical protein
MMTAFLSLFLVSFISAPVFAGDPAAFTDKEIRQIMLCKGQIRCVGDSSYGGPCYNGYGGPLYDGYGGACYAGHGGPLNTDYGSKLYAGYGGNCYKGYGGACYDGYGGNCYSGHGGDGEKCPIQCYTVCE